MIYTIGQTKAYLRNAEKHGTLYKLGKADNFPGGSVWKTKEAAQLHVDNYRMFDYSVFGVLADWDKDTELNPCHSWRNLLKTSEIVII